MSSVNILVASLKHTTVSQQWLTYCFRTFVEFTSVDLAPFIHQAGNGYEGLTSDATETNSDSLQKPLLAAL